MLVKFGSRLFMGINTCVNRRKDYLVDMIVWTSPPLKWWGRNLSLRTRSGDTIEDGLKGHGRWIGRKRCWWWNIDSGGTCMILNQGKEVHAIFCILSSIRFWGRVTFCMFFCNVRWDESLHPLIIASGYTSRCRVFRWLIILELLSTGVGISRWLTPFI